MQALIPDFFSSNKIWVMTTNEISKPRYIYYWVVLKNFTTWFGFGFLNFVQTRQFLLFNSTPKQTVLQLKFSPSNLRSAYYHSVQNLFVFATVTWKGNIKGHTTILFFSVQVSNLVSQVERGPETVAWQQGAEDNIWRQQETGCRRKAHN